MRKLVGYLWLKYPAAGKVLNMLFLGRFSWLCTYKVLLNVGEVFAVLLQCLLEQVGLGGAPLLHFVPAENRSPLRHQCRDGPGHVVARGVERVHGMKL